MQRGREERQGNADLLRAHFCNPWAVIEVIECFLDYITPSRKRFAKPNSQMSTAVGRAHVRALIPSHSTPTLPTPTLRTTATHSVDVEEDADEEDAEEGEADVGEGDCAGVSMVKEGSKVRGSKTCVLGSPGRLR